MTKLLAFLLCVCCIQELHAQSRTDSLSQLLVTTPVEKRIDVYQQIILKLWLNHPDSAMGVAKTAVAFADSIGDVRAKAIATRLLGGVHYYKGNYDSTIKYSLEAYALSESVADSALMTSAMSNAGLAYYNVGSFPEALEFLLRALNLKMKIRQTYGMSQTMNNIGLVYAELKEFDKARAYFQEAIRLSESTADKDQLLYSLNNIGFTYIDQQLLDSAKQSFGKALALAETIDNAIWHAAAYNGAGQVYLLQDSIDQARDMFGKSLALSVMIKDKSGEAKAYSFFGQIYHKVGQTDSALYYLRKSQLIAKGLSEKDLMMSNYDLYKDIFLKRRRYDSAYYYQSQYVTLKDSVFGANLARSIKDIQLQIEREESRTMLAAKDDQIRKITTQTYVLVGALGLLVIGSFFVLKSWKVERRLSNDLAKTNQEILTQKAEIHSQRDELALSHAELERAKEVIHLKNLELSQLNAQLQTTVDVRTRELEEANKELKVVNLELDNFIYRSSHDIRGPLVRLLGICHVALLDLQDQTAKEYFAMFYESAQQLNEIFDRLKIVSHINEVNITPLRVSFSEVLTQVLDKLKTMNGFSDVEIIVENRANEWYTDPFLLELILLNMIENSIRFQKRDVNEKKFVRVRTSRQGQHLQIKVIDNGIGIQEPDLENLYKMFSKSARDHRNIGLGLYIVKQCLSKLNGSISLVQNEHGYTEFEIIHPILKPALT